MSDTPPQREEKQKPRRGVHPVRRVLPMLLIGSVGFLLLLLLVLSRLMSIGA